jgi:hypothetical protein
VKLPTCPSIPIATSLSALLALACGSPASGDPDATISDLADATVAPDAAPPADAPPTPDAPVSDNVTVAEACAAICAAAPLCGFEDDPACKFECAEAIFELECSSEDVTQLAGCAEQPTCDEVESCLFSIPCFDFEGEFCGDGVCDEFEDCFSCPTDCGACVCGDGVCSPGECSTCAADCPDGCTCGDVCAVGPPQDPSCGQCQEEVCTLDPFCCHGAWDEFCVDGAAAICAAPCAP